MPSASSDLITGNAIIGQSGGPTAVINQSLVGAVEGVRFGLHAAGHVKKILGMRHGVKGLTRGGAGGADLVDLTNMHQDVLDRLAATPSACLGSTRDKPDAAYCERILQACRDNDIRYFFYIGGNDSCDTCRIVSEMALAADH
jgi:6-phosphofructokinase 1